MSIKNNQWSIKLAHRGPIPGVKSQNDYLVLFAKNSTAYAPGSWLSKETVDALCANEYWDVTIVSYDESQRRVK